MDQPIKNQEVNEKLEMSRNNNYTAGNLLDYWYHPNYYNPIGTDLTRHTITNIPQQTNFARKLEKDNGATIFLIAEK